MKTILIDDEPWAIKRLSKELENHEHIAIEGLFNNGEDAIEYALKNTVEFALIDIEMPDMNGLDVGKRLREINPEIIIVFVTAHSQYSIDTFKMKADYFVLKPYSKEDIEDALERAKLLSARLSKKVYIRTFGRFEVFVDGKLVHFKSKRGKELLAILVDRRGGMVSSEEILSEMWENKPHNDTNLSLCRVTAARLRQNLKDNGMEAILVESKAGRSLNTDLVDCDLFDYFANKKEGTSSFAGEYMSQYSWAESTLGMLERLEASKYE